MPSFPNPAVLVQLSCGALTVVLAAPGCAGREPTENGVSKPAPTTSASATPSASPASAKLAAPPGSAKLVASDARAANERVEPASPRVYARSRFVWVRIEPDTTKGWLGYLWIGGSAKLRTGKARWGPGCTTWYEIEPRGFVCVDGRDATLDANDPVLAKMLPHAPNLETAWPHRYGESRGLERYRTIPSVAQQRRREWNLDEHLSRVAEADRSPRHDSLTGVDLSPAAEAPPELGLLPATISEARSRMTPLSTIAYSHEARDGGRSWLLTHDFMWVPKDRVAPYPIVKFHGVRLGEDARLPLAFFRGQDRPKYARAPDGRLAPSGKSFARLSHVELSGVELEQEGEKYLETRENGTYVKNADAVVPKPQSLTPWGAPVGGKDRDVGAPAGRRTWIEASIWKGWLIAYEGTRPVYATMMSPGRGGSPEPGKDPLTTASTPTGSFKITGKFATATMEAPGEFIHSDVPWTQNFSGPHALHGAYWHDDWGNRKSAGCVNVSPIDGRWLFEFTEPALPEGWHGVRWRPSAEPATIFVIHN